MSDELLERRRALRTWGAWLTVATLLVLLTGFEIALFLYHGDVGPEQPIPFSHKVHSRDKRIGCLVCHPEARQTETAGIPPVQRCMHCHSRIATGFAPVQDLRGYYERNEPVRWVRVTWMPEYTYFPHSVHLQRSIDCGRCHGDVAGMDRVQLVHVINMGFCVSCHRDYNATVDCFTCHR